MQVSLFTKMHLKLSSAKMLANLLRPQRVLGCVGWDLAYGHVVLSQASIRHDNRIIIWPV